MTAIATFAGVEIARSDDTVVVEGNHYFPIADVRTELLEPDNKRTLCPWKGVASYSDVVVESGRANAAAWTYRRPWPLARRVKDRVAFWNGVDVREG